MNASIVATVVGPDRPGLVESLSRTVADHDGNWIESRMAHLAGQFAGIVRVIVPSDRAVQLRASLESLADLRVVCIEDRVESGGRQAKRLRLEIIGNDRPGIVRDVSKIIAECGINVEEFTSERTSAAMSGEALFQAVAELRVPDEASLDEFRQHLEEIAAELMVDFHLSDQLAD